MTFWIKTYALSVKLMTLILLVTFTGKHSKVQISLKNIDLMKAFNLINHEILLTKLKLYGYDNNALLWFESYLRSRTQYVSLNGFESNQQECNYGVPQGSTLGPLFFILYMRQTFTCVRMIQIFMQYLMILIK